MLEASSSSTLWQHDNISDMQIAPSQSDVGVPWALRLHSTNCPSGYKQSVHPATATICKHCMSINGLRVAFITCYILVGESNL